MIFETNETKNTVRNRLGETILWLFQVHFEYTNTSGHKYKKLVPIRRVVLFFCLAPDNCEEVTFDRECACTGNIGGVKLNRRKICNCRYCQLICDLISTTTKLHIHHKHREIDSPIRNQSQTKRGYHTAKISVQLKQQNTEAEAAKRLFDWVGNGHFFAFCLKHSIHCSRFNGLKVVVFFCCAQQSVTSWIFCEVYVYTDYEANEQ